MSPFGIFMGDEAERYVEAVTLQRDSVGSALEKTEKLLADVTAREVQIGDAAAEIQVAAVTVVALARHVRRLFVVAIASPVVVEALIHLPGWLRHA